MKHDDSDMSCTQATLRMSRLLNKCCSLKGLEHYMPPSTLMSNMSKSRFSSA